MSSYEFIAMPSSSVLVDAETAVALVSGIAVGSIKSAAAELQAAKKAALAAVIPILLRNSRRDK